MDYSFLSDTLLFRGTSREEIESMLGCLGASVKRYEKGQTILRAGEPATSMGLVLAGGAHIESDDVWGNRSILAHVGPGQLFAETYACIPGEALLVNVIAAEKSEVLFLQASRLLSTCGNACAYHNRLIANLLQICARKNLELSRRILHTGARSIRGRLLSYLSEQAKLTGSFEFSIPFNRQQLADYLGVDRSALSNELSKMRAEGLLRCEKNAFSLRQP
ncbi:MAG: Crp/Fnr family transcriptional regulator [Oscillospiraceae bacterium]|nr:Crp/Fnr family transcriptional regulator [Oscillospiraceae bacterium]